MSNAFRICVIAILALGLSSAAVGDAFAADAPTTDRAAASDLPTSASLVASDATSSTLAPAQPRPAEWAQAIEIEGLPNLHKVTDNLYRGAQPTAEGFRELKKLGIKTVVNLRAFHSDRDEMGKTAFDYVHIKVETWDPEEEQVVQFLETVTDPKRYPVFVHCQHGADRTGTMCAIYRIAVQGWTKDEAIREMTGGGYGFHAVWTNLIDYIRNLDVDRIRSLTAAEGYG